MDDATSDWSPAQNPYAIAVSQAYFAFNGYLLFAGRAREEHGLAQQIFGRTTLGELRKLLRCAEMLSSELERLGAPVAAQRFLQAAIDKFEGEVRGIKDARDMLEHFDEYARGEGRLQRKEQKATGAEFHAVARLYWGGGYNPQTNEVTEGPYMIPLDVAGDAARALYESIIHAAKATDSMTQSTVA